MIPREPEETNPEKPEVKEESAPEPEQDLAKSPCLYKTEGRRLPGQLEKSSGGFC